MKGWVTLTDSDINLFSKAIEVIDNLTPEYVTDYEYKWFRKVEYKVWKHVPLWYSARHHIKEELENLMSLLWQGKDVKLWLDSYNEIIKLSKGENTQVGALIIDTYDKVVVSSGWNDLPRGVKHTKERNSRPLKYQFTSHAEMSCLTNALRIGVNVKMKTMLVTLGCCPICMQSIINSGVYELITPNLDFEHISCGEHYQYSLDMAKESGIIWNFDDRLKLGGF